MRLLMLFIMSLALVACGSSPKQSGGGSSAPMGYYRVVKGDTLANIARKHGQSLDSIVKANNIKNPNQLRVGQVLRVRGGAATPPPSTVTVSTPKATTAASVAAPRRIQLIWPAEGSHRRGTGPHSQGVFITGTRGSDVKAAAAGKVMYAGSGLRGYGKMVIVSHDANFISVYAHNDAITVKENQSVKQGQTIAKMGSTDTTAVQLYFELRYNGKAVDATRHLPSK